MPSVLLERIAEGMAVVKTSYHRLVVVVGPGCSGKTTAMQQVRDAVDADRVHGGVAEHDLLEGLGRLPALHSLHNQGFC